MPGRSTPSSSSVPLHSSLITAMSTLAAVLSDPGEDLVRVLSSFTVPTTSGVGLLWAAVLVAVLDQ